MTTSTRPPLWHSNVRVELGSGRAKAGRLTSWARDIAFIELARGELPAGHCGVHESAPLSLPIREIDALIELLAGVVSQARRDGVLPAG